MKARFCVMNKLYVFFWYDACSDNGGNEFYFITDDHKKYADEIGNGCTYAEFEQGDFKIKITKKKGGTQ
jgi:hypothetical protein